MRKRFIVNLSLKLLVVFMLTGFAKIAAVDNNKANIIGMESVVQKNQHPTLRRSQTPSKTGNCGATSDVPAAFPVSVHLLTINCAERPLPLLMIRAVLWMPTP